jgi:hypothetical protein
MPGRGVRGWGAHLSRVERWKEILWGAQTLERSAEEKIKEENSSVQNRFFTGLGKDALNSLLLSSVLHA